MGRPGGCSCGNSVKDFVTQILVNFFYMSESFIDEDAKSLERIRKSVLLPTKDREERKARVNKYLHWVRDRSKHKTSS